MSHGEYQERKKPYQEQRKIHQLQNRLERRRYWFDREQDEMEARAAIANRRQRGAGVDPSPDRGGE